MSFLERIAFDWNGFSQVTRLVEECDFSGCLNERDAEDRLYELFHSKYESIQIIRQYGRGRAKIDLMVGDSVMIEIKYKLNSNAELQRLKGQLDDYCSWGNNLILALIGDTDPAIRKELQRFVNKIFPHNVILDNECRIIERPC
jgi:hypothetical protein